MTFYLVYFVHSFYIIREDVIVRKDTEKVLSPLHQTQKRIQDSV
jgi:hypothetical protein